MNISLYVSMLVALPVLDSVWLFSMGTFYKKWLGFIFEGKFSLAPAALFYAIYALALSYFVVVPALRTGTPLLTVFLSGALLGLAAYGAYDLTNQATIKSWPIVVTVVDMAWGAILSGLACAIIVGLFNYFK